MVRAACLAKGASASTGSFSKCSFLFLPRSHLEPQHLHGGVGGWDCEEWLFWCFQSRIMTKPHPQDGEEVPDLRSEPVTRRQNACGPGLRQRALSNISVWPPLFCISFSFSSPLFSAVKGICVSAQQGQLELVLTTLVQKVFHPRNHHLLNSKAPFPARVVLCAFHHDALGTPETR